MRTWEIVIRVLIAVAAVLTAAALSLWLLCHDTTKLVAGETCLQCAREWIGALSGWAAAAAAIGTGILLWRQIANETAHQRYIRGDEPLKVTFEEVPGRSAVKLHFVNENKSDINVINVQIVKPSGLLLRAVNDPSAFTLYPTMKDNISNFSPIEELNFDVNRRGSVPESRIFRILEFRTKKDEQFKGKTSLVIRYRINNTGQFDRIRLAVRVT
ncbi:hypothetical protein [Breoghania sp.]|uniref:hypothetical protein n=1 Tax=Breoghania sp. TaxID=2065378 RepID=UPI002AAB4E19|nr:hypothetical protein [Breoghania sp.]